MALGLNKEEASNYLNQQNDALDISENNSITINKIDTENEKLHKNFLLKILAV